MKILHIISFYVPAYHTGGPIFSVHNLNKWLVKKGVDVTVYTTDIEVKGKVILGKEVDVDGVKVFYFPDSFPRIWEYFRVFFLPMFLPKHWEYSKDLHKALSKNIEKFDLIHVTPTFRFGSVLGAYYAKKHNKPYIISPRGNLMWPLELKSAIKKKLYIKFIEKANLADADAIHFTVLREKEEYINYNLPYKKAVIIPNGLDEEEFKKRVPYGFFRKKFGIDKNRKIILFLGRLNWKKGIDTLIPAFAKVVEKEPNATLVLAGGDSEGYKGKIEKWIREYGLERNVLFTGVIMGDDKIGALQDSDVFVLPSYSENFGMSVIEAMYLELPVIITENVGISSDVKRWKAGLVIEKDEKELSKAILEILRNPEKAKIFGENGRNLVKKEFVMSQIADRWVEAYNDLINKS